MDASVPVNRILSYLEHGRRMTTNQDDVAPPATSATKRERSDPNAKDAFRMLMASRKIKSAELAKRVHDKHGFEVTRDIAELRGGRVNLANIQKPSEYSAIFIELGTTIESFDQAIKDVRDKKSHPTSPPDKEFQRLIEMVKVALDGPRRSFLKEAIKMTYSAALNADEPR